MQRLNGYFRPHPQGNGATLTKQPDGIQANILVVDDEADIRSGLVRILSLEGYTAQAASSGEEALRALEQNHYDLMVLDMRMPGLDGLAVLDYLHQTYLQLPVIVLTGQASLESAIAAAKSKAVVDYLLKPVSNDEMLRVVDQALQQQVEQLCQQRLLEAASQVLGAAGTVPSPPEFRPSPPTKAASQNLISVFPLTLDRQKRLVTVDNITSSPIELTKGETTVLASLMAAPNQILSCRRLVQTAWGYQTDEPDAATVIRPYISRLRQKLEIDPKKPRFICTVRRRGYRFVPAPP